MQKVKCWIEAMRLRTLPVSVAGVIAGGACAAYYRSFSVLPFLICLAFAVIAQIASNFANEYYDFRNGLDRKGREGFRRGVTEGDITPGAMKRATFALILLDCLLGCSLLFYGSPWIILVGIAVAIFALAYSAGPYPLSHHGLGDLAVVIFFGFVPVTLTCYLQTGFWAWRSVSVPVSVAVGLLAANVLIVNNYRDLEDDRAVGKLTTVVLFGRTVMADVYLLNAWGALAILCVALAGRVSAVWMVAAGLLAILYLALFLRLVRSRGAALNPLLGVTAVSLLLVSLLLLVALSTT